MTPRPLWAVPMVLVALAAGGIELGRSHSAGSAAWAVLAGLIAAAVAGLGIVALDLSWGRANKELAELGVLDRIPRRPVWLVTRAETPERAAIRVVRERIVAIVARRMGGAAAI